MALLSAVTEHNYQADPFNKLTPSQCLCQFIPLSVCYSALCAVCFNAHLSIPIIPILLCLCLCQCMLVILVAECLLCFLSLYILNYSKPFLCFCFCLLCTLLSLSCLSLLICCNFFFPDSLFHLFPYVLASALCSSILNAFFSHL